jgi:hypothetical protein
MDAEWIAAPSQTLDELYAKDQSHSFLHHGILYTGIMRLIIIPDETMYVVTASDTATPTRLLGATIVTPVAPACHGASRSPRAQAPRGSRGRHADRP